MEKPYIEIIRVYFHFDLNQDEIPCNIQIGSTQNVKLNIEDIVHAEEDYVTVIHKEKEIGYVYHKKHTLLYVKNRPDLIDKKGMQIYEEFTIEGIKHECIEIVVAEGINTVEKSIFKAKAS
ncbi:hypothetical protein [Chondrinema litorale]|uniref:hypothetical protein n=1 Tax=Chondrinema litorale TaxID=2994555 RepID=UPI002542E391|nr:hypothetical protein [Chondrinema litorale]UZR95956.1 hypothetical protein OQ292_09035 [Chondrinema litorale]